MPFAKRLQELGIILPVPPQTVANYVGYKRCGNLLFVSGQLPIHQGQIPYRGKVGENLTSEDGQMAARLCAINILSQVWSACNQDWKNFEGCIRLGGFVNCLPDFTDHPKIINGASDLMVEVFGDLGRHTRAAVGVSSLPLDAALEIEGTFLVKV